MQIIVVFENVLNGFRLCWHEIITFCISGPHKEDVLEQKVDQVKNMGFEGVCSFLFTYLLDNWYL